MAKRRTLFSCQNCGAQSPKWVGRCCECNAWNSYVEEIATADTNDNRRLIPDNNSKFSFTLSEINGEDARHQPTGNKELDRVLGGGIVPGSLTLLGGDPGIGKSTIVMQTMGMLNARGLSILYVSGEESSAQIKMRADRLGFGNASIEIITDNCLEKIFAHINKKSYFLIVVDSIQTMYSNKIESAPGTISQVRECAGQFLYYAKLNASAVVLIGHVTKDGAIAGPKVLEHMVDTVLYFEGERGHPFRLLRAVKNRFGGTNEIGVFEMTHDGLQPIDNPSKILLAERPVHAPGSVVVASQEGSRPVLVELQALVSHTQLSNPRRQALGVDSGRLSLLVAVSEKILGLHLFDHDIFLNVAGGIRVIEPAVDLAIIVAVLSSFRNRPIDSHVIVLGEVGLAGEVRAISGVESRLNEAAKMGFHKVILPKSNSKIAPPSGVEIFPISHVENCLDLLL